MPKRLLEHPILPILAGVLVAWDAAGNIQVRSGTLLLLLCWLTWDLWKYTGEKHADWRKRNIIFCLSCDIAAVATMGGMYWLLHSKLEELQEDTKRNLTTSVQMPATDDAQDTYFTLTNGGKTPINHQDYCGIHLIVGQISQSVGSLSIEAAPTKEPLGTGESRSVQCLSNPFVFNISNVGAISCADVEFWTDYTLTTDASKHNKKYFRFVGYEVNHQFVFVPEPPAGEHDSRAEDNRYCGKYLYRPRS
jgi:hypothetical protein